MDDNKKIEEEASSTLENEGIVIETLVARTELEEDLSKPQTKEEEEELFKSVGVEINNKQIPETDPEMGEIKDSLNKEGIELLHTDHKEEDKL